MYRDPQALVLCPESAFRIARAIASEKTDYGRTVASGMEALRVIEESSEKLHLPEIELRYLSQLKRFLSAPPEESRLVGDSVKRFTQKIPEFKPSGYGL